MNPHPLGPRLTRDEALDRIREIPTWKLLRQSAVQRRERWGTAVTLCAIVSIQSGGCPEDCTFCAQSSRRRPPMPAEAPSPEAVLAMARRVQDQGVGRLSLVASGRALPQTAWRSTMALLERLRCHTTLKLCASLGFLDRSRAQDLRNVGVERYHTNLETSRRFFPHVCTTHTWDEKIATLETAREAGLALCSGGILGLGEHLEDRVDLALALRDLEVAAVPLNVLTPIAGTPLGDRPPLSRDEILHTLAMFRWLLPATDLRLAGGRPLLGSDWPQALAVAASGLMTGDYLTTSGFDATSDRQTLLREGFLVRPW